MVIYTLINGDLMMVNDDLMMVNNGWLVVSTYPSEKWWSESQLGWWHSIPNMNGEKNPAMFQTTNQYIILLQDFLGQVCVHVLGDRPLWTFDPPKF